MTANATGTAATNAATVVRTEASYWFTTTAANAQSTDAV